MCGIVGICTHGEPVNEAVLNKMRDSLAHRGPDDAGTWCSPDRMLGLAHRRLSIIDLSPGALQPMTDLSGQFVLVFNGEIYNFKELRKEMENKGHTFKTQSDTEVLIETYRAWGEDCLAHLNGMFSFCLYDNVKKRLFLARDRAGEKPLFYYHVPGKFMFASELKALMADPTFPRTLDVEGLNYYLMYGYIPGAQSILRNVQKLPAGHSMTYDVASGSMMVQSYWQLPQTEETPRIAVEDLVNELEMLLEDAVKHQLVADVPLGILLSGGIDSSIVTAIASRVTTKPLRTFTISFPEYKEYDESPYARLVASHFGTEHTELAAESATVDLLYDLAKQIPLCYRPTLFPALFAAMQQLHSVVTVAMNFLGAICITIGYNSKRRLESTYPRF
jgi:asparagine synthase (glutamine-hydrolysing)